MIRTYSELIKLNSFEERFKYLELKGQIGEDTFGFDRYLNQTFYKSKEWKSIRESVIIRDNGCDLGIDGEYINSKIIIHHMNPINMKDIVDRNFEIMNPEYLICVSFKTHNAIHYGTGDSLRNRLPIERTLNDTCPWRK